MVLTSNSLKVELPINKHYAEALVFPNPNEGVFSVHFYNPVPKKVSVNIYNNIGQTVWQKTIELPLTEEYFDLNFLPNGNYSMEFISKDEVKYQKIVIAKR